MILIIPVIVLALSSIVDGLGVAHSYLPNDVLSMKKSDRIEYKFILQNSDSSSKVMDFKITTQFPMLVGTGSKANAMSYYQNKFTLDSMTNNELVVKFYSPSFAAKFPVTYSYKEYKADSDIGQIQIIQEVSSKFYVSVENSTYLYPGFGVNDLYNNFYIYTESPYCSDVKDLYIRDYNDTTEIFISDYVDLRNMTNDSFELRYNYARSNLSQLSNRTAIITFYGLLYERKSNIRILRNGNDCGSQCKIIDYDSGILTFNVTGFSEYTTISSGISDGSLTVQTGTTDTGTSIVPPIPTNPTGDEIEIIAAPVVIDTDVKANAGQDNANDTDDAALSRLNMLRNAASNVGVQGKAASENIFKQDGAKQLFSVMLYGFITLASSVFFLINVRRREIK